jgi:RNA polymerase sigma-70 factor (ECF subfamily)
MGDTERMEVVAAAWESNREDLLRFARRLVVRPEIAEEIVQHAAQRAISAASAPTEPQDIRKWLFRITSNLAIDELRREGTWSETTVADSRVFGEHDEAFVAASEAMRGTAEVAAIARQHLAFCFSCTLRSLAPQRAAALLLVEVYGFTVKETAGILGASVAQAKNWVQEARASLDARYAETCALINKNGVCYQCSELSSFFNGHPENPLAGSSGQTEDRVSIVRARENHDLSFWHRMLLRIIEERGATRSRSR